MKKRQIAVMKYVVLAEVLMSGDLALEGYVDLRMGD